MSVKVCNSETTIALSKSDKLFKNELPLKKEILISCIVFFKNHLCFSFYCICHTRFPYFFSRPGKDRIGIGIVTGTKIGICIIISIGIGIGARTGIAIGKGRWIWNRMGIGIRTVWLNRPNPILDTRIFVRLKRGGLETSGQRLIFFNSKTKTISFIHKLC